MAEEIVRIIKVDTKNSGKSIKDLKNEIKGLRSELDKAVVGSEEFESTMSKLAQAQRSYNQVQQQVRELSRTNQQDMVRLAGFAKNLAKSYSAVNAAIGLFADGNEDIQKTMLKVQRTIQLIQGLDGIAGLVRDIPKIGTAFKKWLSFLDPVERQINRISKGINGISPQKLRAINEYNRSAASGSTTTTATAGGSVQQINAQTQAIQQQSRVVTALNSAWEDEKNKLQKLQGQLDNQTTKYKESSKAALGLQQVLTQSGITVEGLTEKIKSNERAINLLRLRGNAQSAERIAKLQAENVALVKQREELKVISAVTKNYANDAMIAAKSQTVLNQQIAESQTKLKGYETALGGATVGVKKLGDGLKAVGKTVGWTVVISFAVGVVLKLLDALGLTVDKFWDFITGANNAANAQKKLNKEISEMTNQTSSKAIIALRELSNAYAKVGDSTKGKEKFLQQYADKIKETGLAIDTVKEAEDVFVKNTPKYIKAITDRAKAQAIEAAAVKLYQEYLDKRYDLEQKLQKATDKGRDRRRSKLIKEIDEEDRKINDRMNKLLQQVADLEKSYSGIFSSLETTTNPSPNIDKTDWAKAYKEALDALKKYNQDRLDEMKDARTRELDENKRAYDEDLKNIQETYEAGVKAAQGNKEKLLAVENEKNQALKLAQIRYERTRLEIIDRYNDEVYEKQKSELDREYNLLEKQLERNRRLYDTTSLREPKQANYQTKFNQNPLPLGLGRNWLSVYQSKDDVERQYKDQVKYNNDYLELTKKRINGENALLDQEIKTLSEKAKVLQEQLDSTDLNDLDKRKEIVDQLIDVNNSLETNERTIAENRIALDNAVIDNEQANLDAYLEMQDKKRQALDGILEVTSNLSGALASMFKMEAQNAAEGSKRQKAAVKAYKAFAITQAVADTWKGANEAYAAMASIPYVGPALGIAAAAAAVAMGLANVRNIISEKMTSSSQSASVQAPEAMNTAPINYSRNLLGDKELDNINQPLKCYVLESDITNAQTKVRVTEQNATF